ncbi:rhodanese-like domain-containing protein [Elioraea sp.]|uniref:rhodanese-like domain-containing protein n=1 Tax=Elioraea sp. TaxID=2185103 RepID=UPI003F6FFB95
MAAEAVEIDVATLAAWRAARRPHVVLDVREPWETALAPFPDALAVPMRAVPGRLADLPRDVPLVVLCHHGSRSLRVTYWLRAQGAADAVNLRGGIDAWSSEIDASVPVY